MLLMLLFRLFHTYNLSEGLPVISSQNLAKISKRSALLSDNNPAAKSKPQLLFWDLYTALLKHISFWHISSQTNKASVTNDLLTPPKKKPKLFFSGSFHFYVWKIRQRHITFQGNVVMQLQHLENNLILPQCFSLFSWLLLGKEEDTRRI